MATVVDNIRVLMKTGKVVDLITPVCIRYTYTEDDVPSRGMLKIYLEAGEGKDEAMVRAIAAVNEELGIE